MSFAAVATMAISGLVFVSPARADAIRVGDGVCRAQGIVAAAQHAGRYGVPANGCPQ